MLFKIVLYCAIWPIVCLCGVLGNILTLIVIFRIKESSAPLQYLKSLAMADILTITVRCAYMPFIWWQLFWPDEYLSWTVKSVSVLWLTIVTDNISKVITVVIVLDRIVAVILPFRYKIYCTTKRITKVIVVLSTLIISITAPLIVDNFMYMTDVDMTGNRTIEPSSESESKYYIHNHIKTSKVRKIHILISRLLFDIIPILIVITGNIIIIIGLRRSSSMKFASEDANNQRKYQERQLTKLLLFISFSFLVLCAPYDLLVFLAVTNESGHTLPLFYLRFVDEICRTLTLLNSSINFVIYAVMNRKYREGYKSILACFRQDIEN